MKAISYVGVGQGERVYELVHNDQNLERAVLNASRYGGKNIQVHDNVEFSTGKETEVVVLVDGNPL